MDPGWTAGWDRVQRLELFLQAPQWNQRSNSTCAAAWCGVTKAPEGAVKAGLEACSGPPCPPSSPPGDSSDLWGEDRDGRGVWPGSCLNSTSVISFLLSSTQNELIFRTRSAWSDLHDAPLRGSRCNYLCAWTKIADKNIKAQWYTVVNLMLITFDVRCEVTGKHNPLCWRFTPEIHLFLSFLFPGKQQTRNTVYQRVEYDVTRQWNKRRRRRSEKI